MRKRRNPIRGFNSTDHKSGYSVRFDQHRKGTWSASTTESATNALILGDGNTLAECRKSIRLGIQGYAEWLQKIRQENA
jgi:hypothetical protein